MGELMFDGKPPPHNATLEKQVLNSIMESEQACSDGLSALKAEIVISP